MNSTALGAEKKENIIFISDAHEKFYYEKLKEVGIRMFTTRHSATVLASVTIPEEILKAFMILRQAA